MSVVEVDAQLVEFKKDFQKEVNEVGITTPHRCIYKVPKQLKDQVRDGDSNPYEPELISFGPYHRGKEHLHGMENHKWRCLRHMMTRNTQEIDQYISEIKKLEVEALACYEGQLNLTSNEFVKMLILDGCFILEYLRQKEVGLPNLGYANNDPIFSKTAIFHAIARDMIKLENQVPLIVLNKLLSIQFKNTILETTVVPRLVLRVFTQNWVAKELIDDTELMSMRNAMSVGIATTMLHCLDIFRWSLLFQPLPTPPSSVVQPQENHLDGANTTGAGDAPACDSLSTYCPINLSTRSGQLPDEETGGAYLEQMVYNVTDLRVAGVKFKPREKSKPFWDIVFNKDNGFLEIPPIKIDDATRIVFLNLIAYEQCHFRRFRDMRITDYAAFMDNLIDSALDISHLQKAKIIVHQLGSHDEAADLFNRLVKNAYVNSSDGKLRDVRKNLKMYCYSRTRKWCFLVTNIHKWKAYFCRHYIENPFLTISAGAGILLFIFTFVQSFYAVFGYHYPAKPCS